jgi:hypothetical protein
MSTQKTRFRFIVAALAAFLLVAAGASAQERWFHVVVNEGGEDAANVTINLPLALIETALKLIPTEVHEEMNIEFSEAGIDLEDLRDFWQEVSNSDDATFVTVESGDETVRVAKEGDFLVARTEQHTADGAQVDVRFPFAVLDALFAEGSESLDLAGAIRALADYTDGDIITVTDDNTSVRVWVDSQNEPSV